jgi:chromosomal replication initiation ATPase DnaA
MKTNTPDTPSLCHHCGGTGHLVTEGDGLIGLDDILHIISQYFSVPHDDLLDSSRAAVNVYPRHVAWYCIRTQAPGLTLEKIGKFFGRHHSTVVYGIKSISDQLDIYEAVAGDVAAINTLCAQTKRRRLFLLAPPATTTRAVGA